MFKNRSLRTFGKVRLIRDNGFGQNQLQYTQRHGYASTENQINPKTLTGSVVDNLICQLLMATSYLFFFTKNGISLGLDLFSNRFAKGFIFYFGWDFVGWKIERWAEDVCDSSVKSTGIDRCLPNKSGFRF